MTTNLPTPPTEPIASAPDSATYTWLVRMLGKEFQLAPEQLTLDAPLEALGVDSLGLAEMLFAVEDEFGIVLPPEPLALATVGEVVAFIDGLIAAQKNPLFPPTPP